MSRRESPLDGRCAPAPNRAAQRCANDRGRSCGDRRGHTRRHADAKCRERGRARDHAPLVTAARRRSVRSRKQWRRRLRGGRRPCASRLAGPGRLAGAQGRPARRRRNSCGALERRRRERDPRSDRGRGPGRRRPVWVRPPPQIGSADHRHTERRYPARLTADRGRCAERRDGRYRRERRCSTGDLHRHLRTQEARSCVVAGPGTVRGDRGCGYRRSSLRARITARRHLGERSRAVADRNAAREILGQQVHAGPCAAVRRLSHDRRGANGGAGRGTHRCRSHHDRGAGHCILSLCRSPHQHHGAAAEAGRRPGTPAVRLAVHGVLDRARRRRE